MTATYSPIENVPPVCPVCRVEMDWLDKELRK